MQTQLANSRVIILRAASRSSKTVPCRVCHVCMHLYYPTGQGGLVRGPVMQKLFLRFSLAVQATCGSTRVISVGCSILSD